MGVVNCKLLVFVGICVIGVTNGLVLMEEPDGTASLLFCIVTASALCSKGYTECCVVCIFVLDTLCCNGLVGIFGIGGLKCVLEVAILVGVFICSILMLNVVRILVAVVFCAGV